ncbi:hypothetical protein [Moraxella bovis]|uniref:Uncharacterized protein n=1 Tax=Moraxella bovis TaxID=476 RepID=A0AAQ2Q9V1_MORBO|nr:hypothetical protein [Moraxella bovis]AWY19153.1 hypothetical protein DQF64_00510 [Moraxella bovis]OOR88734.1 hypothetical protein B0182_09565 [Moraxella bovis]UYZ73723.1 hypothetical protein LP105_03140 [Moraxella bovis]UYZ75862.1 hypothetical protein LP093_00525 [Moraxella bovis]UYZ78197.1 hypothetical protein LP115_13330 [Moraxella bovis]
MSETVNLSALAFIFGVGAFAISLICVYAVIKKPHQEQEQKEIEKEVEHDLFSKKNIFMQVIQILLWISLVVSIANLLSKIF